MNYKIYIFLFIILSLNKLNAQVSCANTANIFSFTANGINYEVIKEAKTWTAAASCAVQRGGYLVEINNQAEQTAVYNAVLSASIALNYSPVSDGGGASYLWIGATDKQTEGVWLWDGNNNGSGINFWTGQGQAGLNNGNVMVGNYVNWGGKSTGTINEPDDFLSDQDAGAMALNSWPYGIAGEWNDISSSNSLYYIIEYPNTTNIFERESENTIQLFPNPTKRYIQVKSDTEIKDISLTSIDGRVIETTLTKTIDLNNIDTGIYFLNITTKENKLIVKKIVKE